MLGGIVGRDGLATVLDREATEADLEHLRVFATLHGSVELYVEPETTATDTTAVAVAPSGEWTRRRVGTPRVAGDLAAELGVPVYDVQVTGYPRRMREWTRNDRTRPRL